MSKCSITECLISFWNLKGLDIISSDGEIICECFAATSPMSNQKLAKDLE